MNNGQKPILALESSASSCGAAVLFDQKKHAEIRHREMRKHASMIISLTNQVLTNCGLTLQDLAAVAVSNGPGSFTGLRIGLSAAKGISTGAQIPLITVPTFEAGALQLGSIIPPGEHLWITAKVNTTEYFTAKFLIQKSGYEVVEPVQARTLDEVLSVIQGTDFVAGDSNWFNAAKYVNFDGPSPLFVAQWARDFGKPIPPDEIDYVEPDYYKEFIIKRKSE
jgi:tRNA threonylcarbamoyladenosine biosynthesis protein TsaB